MNEAIYQRVKSIYYQASEQPEALREQYLDQACGDEPDIREELRRLLHERPALEEFLECPAVDSAALRAVASASLADASASEALPETIGRYRVLRLLGEGGMGSVYEAQQESPQRRVALKVLRAGRFVPRVLQRFQQEVEVLGRLQHPGIARIYEAGVAMVPRAAGQPHPLPYFAMELIDGRPITSFAQEHDLSTRQRLTLLAHVCDAVHFGHQHGVIHRDLKPANILVSSTGRVDESRDSAPAAATPLPKIIDFGVARATDADITLTTLSTDAGQILGTLAYMSPEQVRGEVDAIEASSDVYALGVVGYELLANRLPYEVSGKVAPEAARIIRDEEPSRLSSISPVFRGDIETIFNKALEKEPTRRYASAAALAADIRRYLNDEPIVARPPTLRYQLGKFARRHKEFVVGLALVFLTLIAGIVGTTIGLVRATNALQLAHQREKEAKHQAATAKGVTAVLTGMLESADPDGDGGMDGREVRVADLLDRVALQLDEDANESPEVEIEVRQVLAETYWGLGLFDQSISNFERALNLADAAYGRHSDKSLQIIALLVTASSGETGLKRAEQLAREAHAAAEQRLGPDALMTLRLKDAMGGAIGRQGRFAEAEAIFHEVLAAYRRMPEPAPPANRDLLIVDALFSIAWNQERVFHHADGEATMREALRIETEARQAAGSTIPVDRFGQNRELLAKVVLSQGRIDEALELLFQVVETRRAVYGVTHPRTIAIMGYTLDVLLGQGRFQESQPWLREMLTYWRERSATNPNAFGAVLFAVASSLANLGKFDEAKDRYHELLEFHRGIGGDTDANGVKAWGTAMVELGLRPQGTWVNQALQSAISTNIAPTLMAITPTRLDLDIIDWHNMRFELDRWEVADEDAGGQPGWVSFSQGNRQELWSHPEFEPGLYRLRINAPSSDPEPVIKETLLLTGTWTVDSYLPGFDPTGEPNRWLELTSTPAGRTYQIPTLCWRTGPFDKSRGPRGEPQGFGLVITGVVNVPAGDYEWLVLVDDGVRLWVDDELVIDEWRPWTERVLTQAVKITPGEHRVRVEYWQGPGTSTLFVTLQPRGAVE